MKYNKIVKILKEFNKNSNIHPPSSPNCLNIHFIKKCLNGECGNNKCGNNGECGFVQYDDYDKKNALKIIDNIDIIEKYKNKLIKDGYLIKKRTRFGYPFGDNISQNKIDKINSHIKKKNFIYAFIITLIGLLFTILKFFI